MFVKEPGIYSFECQLDVNKKLISNQLNITESKLPVAEFTYYLAKETNNYAIVQFNATKIENEKSYNWSLGNSMISTISNPTYTFTETGNYTIHMEAVTNDGCSSITTKNISIQLTNELFVPTAFTPNNDGVNDRIKLLGIPASTKLSFMIFNEWGQLVYSSTSAADSWDGTYKGEPSNAGNYSYLLTITLNGVEQSLKGIITLIK